MEAFQGKCEGVPGDVGDSEFVPFVVLLKVCEVHWFRICSNELSLVVTGDSNSLYVQMDRRC